MPRLTLPLSPNDELRLSAAALSMNAKGITNDEVNHFLAFSKKFYFAEEYLFDTVLFVPENFGSTRELAISVVKHIFSEDIFLQFHTLTKPIMEGLVTLSMVIDGLNVKITVADLEHIDKLYAILGEAVNIGCTRPVELVIQVECENPIRVICAMDNV